MKLLFIMTSHLAGYENEGFLEEDENTSPPKKPGTKSPVTVINNQQEPLQQSSILQEDVAMGYNAPYSPDYQDVAVAVSDAQAENCDKGLFEMPLDKTMTVTW